MKTVLVLGCRVINRIVVLIIMILILIPKAL